MSTVVPSKGHRHTQSAVAPSATASSQNPQNPHYLNLQSCTQNSQSEMSDSYQSNPTTPPRTPRRNDQSSQNRIPNDNGSKQKPRNKNRPKNVVTSPATTRKGRNTPPLRGAQSGGMPSSAKPMSTPSTTAYAGATFHASPAPSALPIPSFYSKSVPDSPGMKSFKVKDTSLSGSPNTPVPASNTPLQQKSQMQREESPLDFFFRADREEKARAKSASSSQNTATPTGPFNPPGQSPRFSQTPPATGSQNHTSRGSKASPSAIFAMELDGEGNTASPIGPAFSTPYAERINAARPRQQPSQGAQTALDRSEALKAYLFSGQQPPSSLTPQVNPFTASSAFTAPQTSAAASPNSVAPLHHSRGAGYPQRSHQTNIPLSYDPKPPSYGPRTSGRTSGLRQEVTPTRTPTKTPDRNTGYSTSPTPSRTYGQSNSSDPNNYIGDIKPHSSPDGVSTADRNADIQGMEESLRKILKLDSPGSSGVAGQIGSMPAATVSVPNYVGGRPPPMSGMHNGVMGSS
jgi:hypothetical protein